MRGRLIVIDGADGTGKATQTARLVEKLRAQGRTVGTLDFPRYDEPSAWFVEQYLSGKFGGLKDVPAKPASLFYAMDRYAHKHEIETLLAEGAIIVLDRYVSANIGHQAAKFDARDEREAYVRWVEELEYDILGLPRPDLQLVLYLPQVLARQAMKEQGRLLDLLEADTVHQTRATNAFLEAASGRRGWAVVPCAHPDGTRMSEDEVTAALWTHVAPLLSTA